MSLKQINSARIISFNLKILRSQKELTQEQVAMAIGIGTRTYQELESGNGNPTIQTLSLIAQFYGIVISNLCYIGKIKLDIHTDEFLNKIKDTFKNKKKMIIVRDFNWISLWGNKYVSDIMKQDLTKGPFNLIQRGSGVGSDVIQEVLKSEANGIAYPYVNVLTSPSGEKTVMRVYPTLVFPNYGTKPIFAVTYITPVAMDSDQDYYSYCHDLLSCL
jgi:transcriptional regulator with XRE-family HTH domain